MQNSSIIKKGACLLLMGLATVEVAHASFARVAMARLAKGIKSRRMTLAVAGIAMVAESAAVVQKETQSEEQPKKATKKLIFRFPLSFNEDGAADNFSSEIYTETTQARYEGPDNEGGQCTEYETSVYDCSMLRRDAIKDDGSTTEPLRTLKTKLGTYTFSVQQKDNSAEVQFDYSSLDGNGHDDCTVYVNASAFDERPYIHYSFRSGESVFLHNVAGIPSEDGTTVSLQVDLESINEEDPAVSEKFKWKLKRFTLKGCEQNYQKALANKEAIETTKEVYIEKCLKKPIELKVPFQSEVK